MTTQLSNPTLLTLAAGTTLLVSDRPNAAGLLKGTAGLWFNASVRFEGSLGGVSFGNFKVYLTAPDRATVEKKVAAIQGHVAQSHRVFIELKNPVAVTGSRRWATENSHGVEFNVNGALEDVRFFAKGVLQAEALPAAVEPEPARIVATGGMGEAAAQPIAPRKRRTAKKGAAEQPALIAA